MNLTRRGFLKSSLATGSLVSLGFSVPGFLSRTALAAPDTKQKGARDTILVVVQLTGGNDGLNTVVPFADPDYAKLRNALRIPKANLKKVNDAIGLHPSLDGLAKLLEDGALSIVQGVGYPNPSQSHFRSMDIWQTAMLDENASEGWLGRALKEMPKAPSFHIAGGNEQAPLALAGAPVQVPSITSLADYQLQTTAVSGMDRKAQQHLIESAARTMPGQPSLLDFVKRTATSTYDSSRRLQEIGKSYQPRAPYPNTPLANNLKLAAQLIEADLGARIFYVSIDGFDTHANQLETHAALLRQLGEAMAAFYKDLTARGQKDRILMMTFSEFGRRAKENASRGTDHGSAAPMFLVGGKVQAGVIGTHPSLSKLEFGNLKHAIDFRQVYAAVLTDWLGISSKEVLGRTFQPLRVFRS
jgi:uncharacterized protein (DUF1501 family)